MIRQLPARFALVIRGGCAPVIARLPAAWNDSAYKKARRRGRAIAALTPASPVQVRPGLPAVPAPRRPGPAEPEPVANVELPLDPFPAGTEFPWS